jgi:hypothetical protein
MMSECLWCGSQVARPLTGRWPAFCCHDHRVEFLQTAMRWAVAAVKAGRITTAELKSVGPSRIYMTKRRLAAAAALSG